MTDTVQIVHINSDKPSEADWLDRLLSPKGYEIVGYDGPPEVRPGTLFLFNAMNRLELPDAFRSAVRQAGNCGLIHLGDEYFRTRPKDYEGFDFVLRMFPFKSIMGPGMFPLPIGISNNMGGSVRKPASERQHTWMFAGDWKADRGAMAEEFRHVESGFLSLTKSFYGERPVSRDDYLSNMADAIFAPCPAGNVCVETCRPYEALELGAIPLLPSRRFSNSFDVVLGSHPLPSFRNWREAVKFVQAKLDKPTELDGLQSLCLEWWDEFQERTSRETIDFIEQGLEGRFSNDLANHLASCHVTPVHRFVEHIAQQNRRQILTRAKFHSWNMANRIIKGRKIEGKWSNSEPDAKGQRSEANDGVPLRKSSTIKNAPIE